MLGSSTFGLSMWLLKWFPVQMVDRLLLLVARLMLGDTSRFGLERPQVGPLELKSLSGKTPVLDVGTLAKIKSGDIKVHIGASWVPDPPPLLQLRHCLSLTLAGTSLSCTTGPPCDKEIHRTRSGICRWEILRVRCCRLSHRLQK